MTRVILKNKCFKNYDKQQNYFIEWTTSKTWTRTLDLDPEKAEPRKTWTLINLDPEKTWETAGCRKID